jgi:hypothetical protein
MTKHNNIEHLCRMVLMFILKVRQKRFLESADSDTLKLCHEFHPRNATLLKDGPDRFSLEITLHNLTAEEARSIASIAKLSESRI